MDMRETIVFISFVFCRPSRETDKVTVSKKGTGAPVTRKRPRRKKRMTKNN